MHPKPSNEARFPEPEEPRVARPATLTDHDRFLMLARGQSLITHCLAPEERMRVALEHYPQFRTRQGRHHP